MIPKELRDVLSQDGEIMSGAICFAGTRVLVQSLLDTLEHGLPVEDFLEGFPDVSEEQALAVVRWQQRQAREAFGLYIAA